MAAQPGDATSAAAQPDDGSPAAAQPEDAELRRRAARRRRLGWWPRLLMGIASVMAVVAIVATWLNAQVLDTEGWTRTSVRVLENPRVRQGVATEISGRVLSVAENLAKQNLPSVLAPFEGSLSFAAAGALTGSIERALETQTVRELWEAANREVHARVSSFLTGGGPTLSSTGGVVALNLQRLLDSAGQQLGIGNLGKALPPEKRELVLLRSNELATAQMAANVVRHLGWIAPVLAVLLYLAALALGGTRWPRALLEIGAWIVAAALVALLLRRLTESYLLDRLVHTESARPAVSAALSILTSGWRERALWLLVGGGLVAIAGALALARQIMRERRALASVFPGAA
jgi:hypothetical protein